MLHIPVGEMICNDLADMCLDNVKLTLFHSYCSSLYLQL